MGNHPSLYKYFQHYEFIHGCSVVITGASSGMGKEMTYRYAERGCRLVIGARRLEELEVIKNECHALFGNPNVTCVKVDVSEESQAKEFIETAGKHLGGKIDILILCAGISAHSLFEDFTDMAPFRKVVETNLLGCAYPTKYALKYMKKDLGDDMSRKGHIVVLSSFSGEFGVWYRSSYCASKFAVNGFFESLRMELEDKIDITVVCPITVQTEFRNYSLIKT
jgi:short-subunit dehydrogenase